MRKNWKVNSDKAPQILECEACQSRQHQTHLQAKMLCLLILTWLQLKQQVESFVHTEGIKKITDLHNK